MNLFYGQIRASNFAALRQVFGRDPPWPMEASPHVDLVRALQEGRDPSKTAFADYLRLTGRPGMLLERVDVLRSLMASEGPPLVDTCCGSVLDGNHRAAVAIVKGRGLAHREHAPYQTVGTPHLHVEGRRLDDRWPIPYDFRGKTVLDLGCAQGMNTVHAFRAGAARAVLVDHDLTSLTWQVLADEGVSDHCKVFPADAQTTAPVECDAVLAFSVVQHIGVVALRRLAAGHDCILETHNDHDGPPDTGHRWRYLSDTTYSRAEPWRRRRLFLGSP